MKPFDPRLMRLAPGARAAIVALGVLGTVSGLAAIAQALAVAHLVFVVVRAQPLGTAAAWALGAFVVRGLAQAATEVVAARAGMAVSAELRRRLAGRVLTRGPAIDRARHVPASVPDPAPDQARHHERADAVTGPDRQGLDAGRPGPDARAGAGAGAGVEAAGPATVPVTPALTLMTQGATSVEPYVTRYLPALVAAAVLPVAAVIAMAFLHLLTALIPVLTLPLLPLFAALIGMATRDATDRRWQALSQLSGHFLDVMKGLPTLVGYSRAHRQSSSIRAVSEDHREATVATLRIAFLSSAALEFLATIAVALVAVTTGLMLATGRMELETALALILLAPEAYWPIRRVGAEFHNAADGAAALDEIAAVLEAGPSTPTGTSPAVLRARGLAFRYAPDLPDVLRGVNLDIDRGLTVLVGPSGAGKTTLLELVAGLRIPTAGELSAPRSHLVTQRPFLAPASVRDNLRLGAEGAPDDALLRSVLAQVGLGDLLAALPDGLDTPLGDDGFGLSAGQRARFALARALLSDAPLVLLDEPTAHLDPATERHVCAVIRELADHRMVIAISHRPLLVELADERVTLTATLPGGVR